MIGRPCSSSSRDDVRVFDDGALEPRVRRALVQRADAARQLEGAGESGHHVAVALAVELDLPRLVFGELRLVATLDRAQLARAAVREHPAREREREEPDDQERREHDVEQAHSAEALEHLGRKRASF
ncbi:MAG: hypothetical protein LC785_16375 [Acidobacteria bacterium]|nr:hypothetical protein [Acidobacteriota bacterium]